MPGFFRVSVFAVFLATCILAGKANAFDSEALPGFNIEGAFCGISHTKAKTAQTPPKIEQTENPATKDPLLAQSAVKGLMKCHLNIRLAAADTHPCHQMKCCDATSPGGAVPGGALVWASVMETARADNRQPAAILFGVNVIVPLSSPQAPELHPPASIAV
ncbi:MAG: hypothetical protein HQK86_14785 [Nitrospinae bacterium]|nr:hypothetical protein [Nitrospinota bacterium]MBF0634547.1 hypothetical protein [Nitrospinota bacterium]